MTDTEPSEVSLRWSDPLKIELAAAVQRGDAGRLRRILAKRPGLGRGQHEPGAVALDHGEGETGVVMWGMLRAVECHSSGHVGQAEATLAAAIGGGLAFAFAATVTGVTDPTVFAPSSRGPHGAALASEPDGGGTLGHRCL